MSEEYKVRIEKLFKENYSALYIYGLQLINDAETCRDIVSDAFEYLWENYDKLNAEPGKAYLYAYVRARCVDHLRHIRAHERYVRFCMEMTEEEEQLDCSEMEDRSNRLWKALRSLTPRTRHILEESYVHDKTYQTIADEQEISISTVRKHLTRAFQLIREEFAKKI